MATTDRWTEFLKATLQARTDALDAKGAPDWQPFWGRMALAALHAQLLAASDAMRSQHDRVLLVKDNGDSLFVQAGKRVGTVTRTEERATIRVMVLGRTVRDVRAPASMEKLEPMAVELAQWIVAELLSP